ncbi:1-aminocyclopropane-1-carboxylate deaminase/D-cysteine desulfhydrase [Frankia sp. Cr1]|uniref:1-aminocyclopropane-1-carboxylate deaminase/D-cysteine desulfhydrase n=1 Tax=Frankia sp. Cr1 TaxID=3073931 RepID=UPI002AD58723|nr:pyridoxal-phosphate dependent enzyme [Frankia sp. Cr1]
MTSSLGPGNWSVAFPTPLHHIVDDTTRTADVQLYLKRDDLALADVPGNKYRKLKYNMSAAMSADYPKLLTFGGAYSNLLRAVAAIGQAADLPTIGIVRGEEHHPPNRSLQFCLDHGMELAYITREKYRQKTSPEFLAGLADTYGEFYLLPEGASNTLAVRGCAELVDEIDIHCDYITCAVGTGATMAGIVYGLDGKARVVGFSSLKGGSFLADDVRGLLAAVGKEHLSNWWIETGFHFGGYATRKPELNEFMDWFEATHHITLDWVYEAKMLFGVYALMAAGTFPSSSTVAAVIAGGPEPD